MRGGVNTGGRMTRKRTIHDLRQIARRRQGEWWARVFDELFFMYLSGARGTGTDYIYPTSFTGFASNSFVAPDSQHILYGGSVAGKSSITSSHVMDLSIIDRAVTRAASMGGGSSGVPSMQPVRIEGEQHYVLVMHPFQEHNLRLATASGGTWFDIQKSVTTQAGNKSPIFSGALGWYRGVVLHSHKAVIRFSDYGAGTNLPAARGLFMGRQAGVVAFGSPGTGLRFDWHEEARDNGNQAVISTATICGVKKTAFTIDGTSRDFGVIALDTYAADPG